MARKKRVRSNPRAVLYVERYPDGEQYLVLDIGDENFRLSRFNYGYANGPGTRVVFVGGGYSARGKIESSGKIIWNNQDQADLVEEYGSIFDQMLVWLNDPSMPPAGVTEATYDVDI